ncbi:MAG: 23S rRNA (uracil(1939)-C(5))-methyltransferase RlmD [Candidatus Zixiibacteriota bacterium]
MKMEAPDKAKKTTEIPTDQVTPSELDTAATGRLSARQIHIVDLSHNGRAVGKMAQGKVVFLDRGLPGETALVSIYSRSRRYNRGKVLEILSRSPAREKAPCQHFDICGGCSWQDLNYQAQLRFKKKQVKDSLEKLGGFSGALVAEPYPADPTLFYRNKMEFSFNRNERNSSGFNLGLHYRGEFSRVFDVKRCLLQSERTNDILAWVKKFVRDHKLEPYDVVKHTGFLRFLAIREGKRTGDLMLNFVTTFGQLPAADELVSGLIERFPEITTIVHNQNDKRSNIAYGEAEVILFGPGYIHEEILGRRFRVYANSFLQTNSLQAETLYRLAIEQAQLEKSDRLFDLYCGAGTIGICAAERAAEVVGIESEQSALIAADANARENDVSNITFFAGGVRETLREKKAELGAADVVIIDPPRAGMHPRALHHAGTLQAKRIIYISCNPATFSRDAAFFGKAGYQLHSVTPVDMFPHTAHIELVATLDRS